ncbi:hypothetical protein B0H21DRAFT_688884 [Amylocystis lapponica]|nr:hypothetical protein B0H21DRAFT_688884 [Amylocystis lapponica]
MLSARPVDFPDHGPAHPLHTKTPGRGLKGRNALQENIIHHGAMSVNGKAKAAKTPFRQGTLRSVKPSVAVARPLGDKTPFPNRAAPLRTPAPHAAKLAQLELLAPAPALTPGALLRPSSMRKSLRIPRTSTGGGKLDFTTPVTQGNHWDVSDEELQVGAEAGVEEPEAEPAEDFDELEYMPPTALDVPYAPPFEMPDYKVLGRNLLELAHFDRFDDEADQYYAADIEQEIDAQELLQKGGFVDSPSKWERLPLPELEDDSPFAKKPAPTARAKTTTAKPVPSAPASRIALSGRPQTAARPVPSVRPASTTIATRTPSRTTASSVTRAASTRPATSSSGTLVSTAARRAAAAASGSAPTARPAPVSKPAATTRATAARKPPAPSVARTSVYATTTAATAASKGPAASSSRTTPASSKRGPAPGAPALPVRSTATSRARAGAASTTTSVPASSRTRATPLAARPKSGVPQVKAPADDLVLAFEAREAFVVEDFVFDDA